MYLTIVIEENVILQFDCITWCFLSEGRKSKGYSFSREALQAWKNNEIEWVR
jgi:hypothetical protein